MADDVRAEVVLGGPVLERACRLQLLAEGYGGVARPFDAEQARRAYAHTLSDDYLRSAWEYLARRL